MPCSEFARETRKTLNAGASLTFLDYFKEDYKRSHTEKSRKVLRCFPNCRTAGHRKNGFCGTAIKVEASSACTDLHFWGTFATLEKDPVAVGDIVDPSVFEHEGKQVGEVIWVPGAVSKTHESSGHNVIEFTPPQASWDYSWFSSHKVLSNIKHCFVVVGCRYAEKGWHVCTLSHSSPFQIYSKSLVKSRRTPATKRRYEEIDSLSWTNTQSASPISATSRNSEKMDFTPFRIHKDALTPLQKRNLTLDRLCKLCLNPARYVEGMNHQDSDISKHHIGMSSLMTTFVETLFQDVLLHALSNPQLDEIVNRWMEPRLFANFNTTCATEIASVTHWNPEQEYNTCDLPGSTFYEQIREGQRAVFAKAMAVRDLSPESLFDFAEYLSDQGFLDEDPFHPPTVRGAEILHLQIYPQLPFDPNTYCAGCSEFVSWTMQEQYARDLLLLNQRRAQLTVQGYIMAKFEILTLKSNALLFPVHSGLDLTGAWSENAVVTQKLGYPGILGQLTSPNISRTLRFAIGKLTFLHTSSGLVMDTDKLFMFGSAMGFKLDEDIHLLSMSHPIAQISSISWMSKPENRKYLAITNIPRRTINILVDIDLPMHREGIQSRYHLFHWDGPEQNFKYYQMISFELLHDNALQVWYSDYFIPASVNSVLSVPFVNHLIRQSVNCPYLTDRSTILYSRCCPKQNDDMIPLSLLDSIEALL